MVPNQGFTPGAMQPALANLALIASHATTIGAYAWKGMQIIPAYPFKLYGIMSRFEALVSSGTYQGMICTVDGSVNLNWLIKTNKLTLAAASYTTGMLIFHFAEPIMLQPGVTYQMLVGCTSGADNYVLTLQYLSTLAFVPQLFHLANVGTCRIAKANPALTNAVSINASDTVAYCIAPIAEFDIYKR
jgi:hypothetical protein